MESLLSMIFFFGVFCVPAAPLANRGGFSRQDNLTLLTLQIKKLT